MNLKTTLIVAIVALALGGYIYFYEREPIEDTDPEREKVFDIESTDIEEIEIVRTEGEDLKLVKDRPLSRLGKQTEHIPEYAGPQGHDLLRVQ